MLQIEALLRRHIGLEATAIGPGRIRQTIQQRMARRGLKSIAEYEQHLYESPAELDCLIEAVVVTETWFFRDRAPFDAFARMVTETWRPQHPTQTLRILSVPCSSGEEPFSAAMILADAGIAPDAFQIDAMDISQHALTRAARAVYSNNSFRGANLDFRQRHFQQVKGGFALNPVLRRSVSFQRANVLDAGFLASTPPYDFIFCRNLLIYFDRFTQASVLAKLHRSLAPDGVLFVGPAEVPIATRCGFTNLRLPLAFACHKSASAAGRRCRRPPRSTASPGPLDGGAGSPIPLVRPMLLPQASTSGPHRDAAVLSYAHELAASGRLEESAALCWRYLQRHPDCAECFYLLGLIQEVNHDPQAIESYRKALYLDPQHYESLERSMVWWEQQGHPARANVFKRRMLRLAQQRRRENRRDSEPLRPE
ncbi:MAG TPA: CheR family methyltransferase [Verrucomicrobiota bacterium]|nr:CheR family methyltransferase [Verrucomicrobiota bacterium]HNT14256.1 CheR family methyltransferase [Verrucomicrobiota bacterium]